MAGAVKFCIPAILLLSELYYKNEVRHMKKIAVLFMFIICIAASLLTDTYSIYTKTAPALMGTVTAQVSGCSHYPLWNAEKELRHEYHINDYVIYHNKLYKRINSGASKNYLTPDKNKSYVLVNCDKCLM